MTDPGTADLRSAPPPVLAAALALNAEVEAMTSPLDDARLGVLLAEACAAPAILDPQGRLCAFLIGFAPGAAYDSPNYRWFSGRMDRFAYIDRVVVAPAARGRGLARRLYAAFAEAAAAQGLGPLVCEVNTAPPNPVSDAFHAALGFAEVGRADLGPGKSVRYLMRSAS